jgi:hypothetical protein
MCEAISTLLRERAGGNPTCSKCLIGLKKAVSVKISAEPMLSNSIPGLAEWHLRHRGSRTFRHCTRGRGQNTFDLTICQFSRNGDGPRFYHSSAAFLALNVIYQQKKDLVAACAYD